MSCSNWPRPDSFDNMIVIVLGLPGSGKSYFAARFAELIHADHVNSDRVRKSMFIKEKWEPLHGHRLILLSADDNIEDMLHKAVDYIKLTDDKRAYC